MSTVNIERDRAICRTLSEARLGTYIQPFEGQTETPVASALELYIWNAKVSGAFLAPLHVCEVVVRNAASESLSQVYGADWPWSSGFQMSLPDHFKGKVEEACAKGYIDSTGKFIAEMNFGFWKYLFTSRYEDRLWQEIRSYFPGLPSKKSVNEQRELMRQDLERVGKLRNRIAHHEPIFKRNLARDLFLINRLVKNRCPRTASWMEGLHEGELSRLIAARPIG